jgi:protein TonB
MRYVERMPKASFNLNKWLGKNIHYPKKAQQEGIEGRVLCKFIVNEDGSISDVTVIKAVSPELDAEAVRVLSRMPAWEPGMQNGKAVKVYFTIPIAFALEGSKKDPKTLPR